MGGYKMECHSNHCCFSMRWVGVDPKMKVTDVKRQVHQDRKVIKRSWTVGLSGDGPHYASINVRNGNGAQDHVSAYTGMKHQRNTGLHSAQKDKARGDKHASE